MHAFAVGHPDPLGVTPDGHGGANVALWAAGATAAYLCIFDEQDEEVRIALSEQVFGVFYAHIAHLPAGTRYGFRVDGPWDPHEGHRWNVNKLLLDPYARAIDGDFHFNSALFGHRGQDDLTMSIANSAPFMPKSVVVDY